MTLDELRAGDKLLMPNGVPVIVASSTDAALGSWLLLAPGRWATWGVRPDGGIVSLVPVAGGRERLRWRASSTSWCLDDVRTV